jgi:hypothetical protein
LRTIRSANSRRSSSKPGVGLFGGTDTIDSTRPVPVGQPIERSENRRFIEENALDVRNLDV